MLLDPILHPTPYVLDQVQIRRIARPFNIRNPTLPKVPLRSIWPVAWGIVLHPNKPMIRVYMQESLDIIKYNCIILIWIHTTLFFLPKDCWSFSTIDNRAMKHLSRQLWVLMLQAIYIILITPVFFYCNKRLRVRATMCPDFVRKYLLI
jgi:hypothetical protein